MILYLILEVFCLLPVLFFRTRRALLFSCFLIAVLLSLRCNVGDYDGYYLHYKTIKNLNFSYLFADKYSWLLFRNHPTLHEEYGFILLQKLFPFRFYVFVAAITFFFIGCVYWLIRNNVQERYYPLAVFLLLNPVMILINMSALRQGLASAFLILAFLELNKKRQMLFLLLILIGGCFHKSLILLSIFVFLPFFIADKKKLSSFYCYFFLVLLICCSFLKFFIQKVGFYSGYTENLHSSNYFKSFFLISLPILSLLRIHTAPQGIVLFTLIYSMTIFCRILCLIPGMSLINRYYLYFDIFSLVAIPMCLPRLEELKRWIYCYLFVYVISCTVNFFVNPLFIGETKIDFMQMNLFAQWDNFSAY